MKKYILFACLAFKLTSCQKEIINSETGTSNFTNYENPLQKDLKKNINDSRVKIVKVDEKEVSKQEPLQININNVSSTTLVIHKPATV